MEIGSESWKLLKSLVRPDADQAESSADRSARNGTERRAGWGALKPSWDRNPKTKWILPSTLECPSFLPLATQQLINSLAFETLILQDRSGGSRDPIGEIQPGGGTLHMG